MKLPQLKWLLGLILVGISFTACKKSENPERNGVINIDVLFTCNSCPGSSFDIKFTNDTTVYHISNNLMQFGITKASTFPVNVTVNSKPNTAAGSNFVIITALKINH